MINKDVKAENLEAVALALIPAPTELELLLNEGERLHCEQTFLAHLAYLFKQEISVDRLLLAQVVHDRR